MYHSHPLTVTVQIYDEKQKGSKLLTLKAEYLMTLDVLCAGEEGTPPAGVSPVFSLANLFPNDPGLELPTKVKKLIVLVIPWRMPIPSCYLRESRLLVR